MVTYLQLGSWEVDMRLPQDSKAAWRNSLWMETPCILHMLRTCHESLQHVRWPAVKNNQQSRMSHNDLGNLQITIVDQFCFSVLITEFHLNAKVIRIRIFVDNYRRLNCTVKTCIVLRTKPQLLDVLLENAQWLNMKDVKFSDILTISWFAISLLM